MSILENTGFEKSIYVNAPKNLKKASMSTVLVTLISIGFNHQMLIGNANQLRNYVEDGEARCLEISRQKTGYIIGVEKGLTTRRGGVNQINLSIELNLEHLQTAPSYPDPILSFSTPNCHSL